MALTPEQLDYLRRHSKLRIDRESKFWLDGRLVENERVQLLFHQCLHIEESTGDLKLVVGQQWAYIETIDDTGWFVRRVEVGADGCMLTLADESRERLDPSTLTMATDTDVYCVISGNRRARFLRAALIDIAPALEETKAGIGLRAGDVLYDIATE